MKRKITTNLSVFKYKRPCPILKEDMNRITTDREASSDEELLISPFKKCKLREANCTKSSGKNSADEKYSSKTILDSSSDDDTENCRSEKAESIKTFDESSDSSSFTSLTFNESTSLEQDDTNYRLGVLKGIFKNSYTEGKLLNAINDTNGLDHAVSVLIESTSDNEEDDDSVEQDLEKLMKKFPACDKEELRTVLEENSFCLEDAMGSLELFSSPVKKKSKSKEKRKKCIDFDEVVDCVTIDDNSDIGNNSDDNKNTSDVNKSTSDVNKNTSAELGAPLEMSGLTQAITIVHDDCDDEDDDCDDCDDEDDDYGLSDGEQDLAMSSADKASVVSFVDSADVTELALVKGCSVIKAKMICSLRPFSTWRDLLKKVHYTKGLTDEFLWECQTFVNERDKMGYLMEKCERISKAMKDCIEVKSSSTENASMLVTKKQYVTKEPSLVPSGAKLKSYQLTGLNWLIALHKRGLNGILADEMGLGKTIQSIVFLAYLLEQEENGPHLIVVPSSTFDNWKRELEGWCPSIKCLHYYGSAAERSLLRDEALDSRHEFHVLLTTYAMAISSARDRTFMKKMDFHYAIYDEAHMLKNMKALRYQQLLHIKPRRMLMLTGTPIQNNLLELMSLLSFVMPDMFAERIEGIKLLFGDNKVKQNKETAYQKEKVIQAKRIMEPFVLRRVKTDVLGNILPEKYEHCVECDVPSRQRKVYDKTFASFSQIVHSGEARLKGAGVLVELRKAANHSLLIRNYYTDDMLSEMAQKYCKDTSHRDSEVNLVFEDMQVMSDFELSRLCLQERCLKDFHLPHELIMDSGKFLYLDSVLPKMKEKGDRILLFNQFVMTMDILEVYLQTRGHKYLRLDGSVSVCERQGLIDRFNTEEDIFMFIISTRAGGMGINLTAANVVILYDSDYNPHNDKQAECRCHRLGQTREVNVYRLICKDTCEEDILKCANDKIRLHEDISGNQISNKEDDIIQSLVNVVFGSSSTKLEEKQ